MTSILTQIATLLDINPADFAEGLTKGRKAVKLACSLGASYDTAELLAPLRLASTEAEIDEAYASPVKSCMQNKPVGRYYAQLNVQCLHSLNFRALIMPHPTTPGMFVTPRVYGVHGNKVAELLGDLLVVDPDLFASTLPREEWVEDHSSRELVHLGVYEYTAEYGQPKPAWPSNVLDFALDAGPFPRYDFEAPHVWERLYADLAERFYDSLPRTATSSRVGDLPGCLTAHLHTATGRLVQARAPRKTVKSRTLKAPQYRIKHATPVLFSQIKRPRVAFVPYQDYRDADYMAGVPLPAFHGNPDLPDPWEDLAYAEEARFEGYRY